MTKNKKRKVVLTGAASLLCITTLLTGTFAWISLSQEAVNEVVGGMINPGGRLHDDFNGNTGDKNIYVENFTGLSDGKDIVVRIRLREYMELGENAGNPDARTGVDVLTQSADPADITNYKKWDIYHYGQSDHFDDIWEWTEGGLGIYMPTFNKNKDSKTPDLNGTINGTGEGGTPGVAYSDYHAYQRDEVKTAAEIHDADSNTTDEPNPVEGENITYVQNQTHIAKATKLGAVMSMEEWQTEKGSQPGPYWVYDTDGWAYWAEPLKPQTATGLLLDHIEKKKNSTQKWYYAIYVEAQMADADGVGNENDASGFYSTEADGAPTEAAKELLAAVLAQIGEGSETISEYMLQMEQQRKQQQEIQKIYEEILEKEALEAAEKEKTEETKEPEEETVVPDPENPPETTPEQPTTPEAPSEPDPEQPTTPEVPSKPDPEQPTTPEAPSEPDAEPPKEPENPQPSEPSVEPPAETEKDEPSETETEKDIL